MSGSGFVTLGAADFLTADPRPILGVAISQDPGGFGRRFHGRSRGPDMVPCTRLRIISAVGAKADGTTVLMLPSNFGDLGCHLGEGCGARRRGPKRAQRETTITSEPHFVMQFVHNR